MYVRILHLIRMISSLTSCLMESNIKHISYQSEAMTVLNYVVYSLVMYTSVSGRVSLPYLAPPLELGTVLFGHKISLFVRSLSFRLIIG